MEGFSLTEQIKQELSEESVQMPEKEPEKLRKKRSQSDKIGINKYNQQLLKRVLMGIEDFKAELRWVRHKLDRLGEAAYSASDIEHFAKADEVDLAIIQRVREAGSHGVLPKVVAIDVNRLGGYCLRYYEVSRRIVWMNKKVHFETGKLFFENHGHRWALTRFGFDSWGRTIEEAKAEVEREVSAE